MELADVEIAKVADLGVNDERTTVRTHLGKFLQPGSTVLGYNLNAVNCSGLFEDGFKTIPTDVILVRRQYKKKRGIARNWDLQRLARERDEGVEINDEADMEMIRQDLEEDEEMRRNVNMYRTEPKQKAKNVASMPEEDEDDDGDEDAPEVPLAELLEGLELADGPIACGGGLVGNAESDDEI